MEVAAIKSICRGIDTTAKPKVISYKWHKTALTTRTRFGDFCCRCCQLRAVVRGIGKSNNNATDHVFVSGLRLRYPVQISDSEVRFRCPVQMSGSDLGFTSRIQIWGSDLVFRICGSDLGFRPSGQTSGLDLRLHMFGSRCPVSPSSKGDRNISRGRVDSHLTR